MKVKKLGLILMFVLLLVSSPLLYESASAQEMNGLIALLTDYGERDFYAGALKGLIYSIYPDAKVVDITHDIEPFNIHEGAVTLLLAARSFPQGTVFVAIVDPGVGTERRAIIVRTNNNLFFVGPDNGLMTLVMQEFGVQEIREITNESWMRLPVSYTFHGRDIFAPTAAHLAQGWPMAEAGPIVTDPIWLPIEPARVEGGKVIGQVLMIDQYGNIQANITKGLLEQIGLSLGDLVSVQVGNVQETSPFLRTYGDVPEGEDLIFIASTDFVEISINMGNAAEKFGARIGLPVVIEKSTPGLILTPRILATPTPIILATPILAPSPTLPPPTICTSDAAFVQDVTIPDYTVVQPGERFDKIWRFQNTGTCAWGAGYRLAFITGEKMGAPDFQAVPSTPPGGLADISVPMYSPTSPGTFESRWRMVEPNGVPFGQTVLVIIQVPAPATAPPPTPTSPPPSAPTIDFRADDYDLNVGECTMLRWDVENVQAVFLRWDGHEEGVVGHSQREVCLSSPGDFTYTLHVIHAGGSEDRTVTIHVAGGPPPPPGQPDLIISELSLNPASPHQGEAVTVRVGDYNQGDAPAGHHKVQWRTAEGGPVGCEWDVDSLVARGGRILTCNYTYPGWNPAYTTRATTDVNNEVSESNEGNNSRELVVNVQPASPSPPSTHSTGLRTVRGTWCFDLDEGQETNCRAGTEDFWWEQVTDVERYLTPQNGASFAVMGASPPQYNDCAGAPLSTSRINGSNNASNWIPAGTYLCARTNAGRYSEFRINSYGYDLQIGYTTWE